MRSGSAADHRSLEARVAAFRADPQLMEAASRFVADVLEKAKEEALRRLRQERGDAALGDTEDASRAAGGGASSRSGSRTSRGRRERWGSRAQGYLVRFFASLCLCNSNGTGTTKGS